MIDGEAVAKARVYGVGYVTSGLRTGRSGGGRDVCTQPSERADVCRTGDAANGWDIGFLLGFSFGLGAVLTCALLSWVGGLTKRHSKGMPPVTEAENESHECSICMHYRINCVLDPCGHQFCAMCAQKVDTCPVCRKDVIRLMGTYR
mmetsp:Transcript_12365/g.37714  ORF Transcript_12365/g.37714 Transcript_12365/m.37714 type:complete len:147 (-) Transcript_12365:193-633(-)